MLKLTLENLEISGNFVLEIGWTPCPLRNLHEYSDIVGEFKDMHRHIDRHLNEKSSSSNVITKIVVMHFVQRKCLTISKVSSNSKHLQKVTRKVITNHFLEECLNEVKTYGDSGQATAIQRI